MVRTSQAGFTLVELVITMVVVGILTAIALPSYDKYMTRARRSEARTELMEVASRQERYYSDSYQFGTLTQLGLGTSSENGHYTLSVTLASDGQSFTATAAPARADADCGSLTLDEAGTRGNTGGASTSDCWGR